MRMQTGEQLWTKNGDKMVFNVFVVKKVTSKRSIVYSDQKIEIVLCVDVIKLKTKIDNNIL